MNLQTITSIISNTIFLSLVAGIPLYGAIRGVKVYEAFVEGAKDGFQMSLKLFPLW